MSISLVSLGLALLGGLVTVLSPCILPILPIVVGRSLQSHRYGPIALGAGLVGGFALAGSVLGIPASWLTDLAELLRTGAIALLLLIGLLALFPKWRYGLVQHLSLGRWMQQPVRTGLAGEFWLGTQLGLLWTPCAGPVLGSILVLAAVDHRVGGAFVLLVCYGIGAAMPLLLLAYGGRLASRQLLSLRPHGATIQRVGGVMVLSTAIAMLLGWDIQLQLWLAPLFPPLPL